jgi:hypothetical protein
MDGSRDLAAITASIRDGFDEVPDTVDEEIAVFVKDLEERGFVGYEVKGEQP